MEIGFLTKPSSVLPDDVRVITEKEKLKVVAYGCFREQVDLDTQTKRSRMDEQEIEIKCLHVLYDPKTRSFLQSLSSYRPPEGKHVLVLQSLVEYEDAYSNITISGDILRNLLLQATLEIPEVIIVTKIEADSPFLELFQQLKFIKRGIREENSFLLVFNDHKGAQELKFGIEFETCVCENLEVKPKYKYVNSNADEEILKMQEYIQLLNQFAETKLGLQDKFKYRSGDDIDQISDEELYKTYFAIFDASITCPTSLDEQTQRTFKKTDAFTAENCKFTAVELVTPIISNTPESIGEFVHILDEVILHENFLYESNSTQGLHINVSHPDMITPEGKRKLIQMWWVFEPLILLCVPAARRNNFYAKPLRERAQTFDSAFNVIDEDGSSEKYRAIHFHPNRVEFRLTDASMDREHILMWLQFYLKFVYAAIFTPVYEEFFDKKNQRMNLFEALFTYFIKDKAVEGFIKEKILSIARLNDSFLNAMEYRLYLSLGIEIYAPEVVTIVDLQVSMFKDEATCRFLAKYASTIRTIKFPDNFILMTSQVEKIKKCLPQINWKNICKDIFRNKDKLSVDLLYYLLKERQTRDDIQTILLSRDKTNLHFYFDTYRGCFELIKFLIWKDDLDLIRIITTRTNLEFYFYNIPAEYLEDPQLRISGQLILQRLSETPEVLYNNFFVQLALLVSDEKVLQIIYNHNPSLICPDFILSHDQISKKIIHLMSFNILKALRFLPTEIDADMAQFVLRVSVKQTFSKPTMDEFDDANKSIITYFDKFIQNLKTECPQDFVQEYIKFCCYLQSEPIALRMTESMCFAFLSSRYCRPEFLDFYKTIQPPSLSQPLIESEEET